MIPQPLLLPLRCPACGRSGRELSPCPWCGEAIPPAPRSRGDIVRLVAGLALLAAGTMGATEPLGPASMALVGLPSGFFLVFRARGSGMAEESVPAGTAGAIGSALLAAALALALRAFGVPFPPSSVVRLAWLFPLFSSAAFVLRVPAEAPNAPAFDGSAMGRTWRRHAPDFVAALSIAPFVAAFAAGAAGGLSLVGLSLVLGVWLARLATPAVPLLLSSVFFSLLLPDPAFFAFGLLAPGLAWARAVWNGSGGVTSREDDPRAREKTR